MLFFLGLFKNKLNLKNEIKGNILALVKTLALQVSQKDLFHSTQLFKESCRNWGWTGAETRIVLDYDILALETTA